MRINCTDGGIKIVEIFSGDRSNQFSANVVFDFVHLIAGQTDEEYLPDTLILSFYDHQSDVIVCRCISRELRET